MIMISKVNVGAISFRAIDKKIFVLCHIYVYENTPAENLAKSLRPEF